MKPTVISRGSNENPQSHPTGNVNPNTNVDSQGHQQPNTNNPNGYTSARQFPQFESGFDFDEDDIFSDAGLRARLNRFRDPWGGFGRKRGGNETKPGSARASDPYDRYFQDEPDFFPSLGRRRVIDDNKNPNNDDFFNYVPAGFRDIIPEGFGFPKFGSPKQTRAHQQYPQQEVPQSSGFVHPQQTQQQAYVHHPQYEQHEQQEAEQRPKFCDAAIQTEVDPPVDQNQLSGLQPQNLNQHGLRNTVDMGQRSPSEDIRGPRAHSAPPHDVNNQNISSSSASSGYGPEGAHANAQIYTAGDPNQVNASAQSHAYADANARAYAGATQPQARTFTNQGTSAPTPPPRQNVPQFQQQPQQQGYSQSPPQARQQNSSQQQPDNGFVRHVPIFIEGRSPPAPNQGRQMPPRPQTQQQPQPQHQYQPFAQHQQQEHYQPQPTQDYPQQKQQQHRPTPLNTPHPTSTAGAAVSAGQVPQTPRTEACINKIQEIQRDVLNLMSQVEHFKGARSDKEYMLIDEMLTRNLLKLDTIDTNGKDSIRLARREAVKCIQASINVLEAKAEENIKTAAAAAAAQSAVTKDNHNSPDDGQNTSNDGLSLSAPSPNTQEPQSPMLINSNEPIPLPDYTRRTEEHPAVEIPVVAPESSTAASAQEDEASNTNETTVQKPIENSAETPSPPNNETRSKISPRKKIVKKIKKLMDKEKKEKSPDPEQLPKGEANDANQTTSSSSAP